MVCISCFMAPLLLFIWYKFIYPLLQPIVSRIWNNYQLPQPFANLTCPLPQNKTKTTVDQNKTKTTADQNTASNGIESSDNSQETPLLATDDQKKDL